MNPINFRKVSFLTTLICFVLITVGCQSFSSGYTFNGNLLDPPMEVPDFELASTQGQPYRLSDTAGEITLIFFGYTFCPDVCPLTMADVKQALVEFEQRDRVNVIFVSVDPERDTVEVLSRYMDVFDSSFVGLTDDMDKTQEVMTAFGAFAERVEVENSAADYLINHTARVYLIDAQGDLLLTYPFGFEPEGLRADLEHLIEASES